MKDGGKGGSLEESCGGKPGKATSGSAGWAEAQMDGSMQERQKEGQRGGRVDAEVGTRHSGKWGGGMGRRTRGLGGPGWQAEEVS